MIDDKKTHLKEKAAEELRLLLLVFAYLAVFFVAFSTYRRLISRELGVGYFRYGYALLEAFVIAKVILIGKAIGLDKRTTRRTLALSVLRASVVYGALVAVFSVLEHLIEGLVHGKTLVASFEGLLDKGVYEILGRTLVLFVALLPFFAFWELDRVLGDKKLFELFFRKGAGQTDG